MNYRPYIDPNKLPAINYGNNSYVNNKENTNDLMFKRNLDNSLHIQQNTPVPTYFNEQYTINRKNADFLSKREHGNQYYQFQRNAGSSFVDFSSPINPIESNTDYSKYITQESDYDYSSQNKIKYFCPRCKSTELDLNGERMSCLNCNAVLRVPK